MRHRFAGIRAIIDDQSVAAFLDPQLVGQFGGFQQQMSQNLVVLRFGLGDSGDRTLRDD